ncbi:MAG TPA: amidohydrolase/deacetylase family metallohydrolase [Clostridium sp.]|uniref:amidohydrolase/deacetylase family metallohydrolase n=1 Tax=Clostridium sp. TaxID=1506 RepID=UPI002F931810
MSNLLIKGGKLLAPHNGYYYNELDILLEDGMIKEIGENLSKQGNEVLELDGEIVAPGFIDIHTHCYKGKSLIGTKADVIGIQRGTTTIFDAGTSGALNYDDFKVSSINKSKTHIYTFLNISDWGLNSLSELRDLQEINEERIIKKVEENRHNILGIKARASASVVGENGIIPIIMGKKIAKHAQLPLMVHIGNYPPDIMDVINILEKDDIVTHSYHGKKNGLFNENGTLKKEVLAAKERGVKFDVGHGSASFSFDTFRVALKNNFRPDFISTDLYHKNMIEPVGSLLNVITKLIACGMTLEECVNKVTYDVAKFFNLNNIGQLKNGSQGDLTIFNVKDCNESLKDSYGNKQDIQKKLELKFVVVTGGEESEVFRFNKE